jgi:TonB family protein
VFGIDAPGGEARLEPRLVIDPGAAPRLALLPGSSPPPDGEEPVASQQRPSRFSPLASLVLHLLPLLLLLNWPMHPPAEVTPIPVQLVFQPPPAPKPAPEPRLKPETRPPPGRIASVDMGEVRKNGHDEAKSEEPAAKKEPAATTESPLEAPQQTAFLPPPPALPDPPALELPKPPEHKPIAAPKPPKSSMAARRLVRRAPEQAHLWTRLAKYPGPAATRDEYLAYLAALARQHIGLLSPALIAGRRGETIINVLVLDDGTVAMLKVGLSSGYPDIDARVEQMIRAVGRFPPLPQWYQERAMLLEFRLHFPEALAD